MAKRQNEETAAAILWGMWSDKLFGDSSEVSKPIVQKTQHAKGVREGKAVDKASKPPKPKITPKPQKADTKAIVCSSPKGESLKVDKEISSAEIPHKKESSIKPSPTPSANVSPTPKQSIPAIPKTASSPLKSPIKDIFTPTNIMKCFWCGQKVPVHAFHLEKSKLLCPECYSKKTPEQIDMFNRGHIGTIPNVYPIKGDFPKRQNKESEGRESPPKKETIYGDSDMETDSDDGWIDYAFLGGRISERAIAQSTIEELRRYVRKGQLSKARFSIEIKRRRDKRRFVNAPDPNHMPVDM